MPTKIFGAAAAGAKAVAKTARTATGAVVKALQRSAPAPARERDPWLTDADRDAEIAGRRGPRRWLRPRSGGWLTGSR